jgi:amicoumacin kinase
MPNWQNRFDQDMLVQAGQLIGVDGQAFKHIGGFENVIYGYKQDDQERILRVTYTTHRSVELMESEMHFMDYLAKHGVQVACPVAFASGKLVECLSSGEDTFILTLFEFAPGGETGSNHENWGIELFEEWGEITGKMHALAQNYKLADGMTPRPYQDSIGFDTSKFGPTEQMVYEKLQEVSERINALPQEKGAFGLCHRDLHHGNFHVHNGQIIAFDFDDCGYDYFVHDIAMAVYYSAVFGNWRKPNYKNEQVSELANEVLVSFMKGYHRYHQLDAKWLEQLPLFIEKRRLELFLLTFEEFSNSSNEDEVNWRKHNLQEIEQGMPCMEIRLD